MSEAVHVTQGEGVALPMDGTAPLLAPPAGRGEILCLIPPMLGAVVEEAIAAHFAADRRVEALVERRRAERRSNPNRRAEIEPWPAERRRIRNLAGRRIGERRAELVPRVQLVLPLEARRFASRIRFVERIAPSEEQLTDLEDLRLVTRLQSGDESAFDPIYERYLARLHVYAHAALDDQYEAEDVAHEVLIKMLEAVPDYEIRGVPFRIWLFRVMQNHVRNHFAKHRRMLVEDPTNVHKRLEADGPGPTGVAVDHRLFERFARDDFMGMIDPLSGQQRQVLALRFLLGFDLAEIAALLGTTPNAAANLQYRALGALRREEEAPCREPGRARFAMRRLPCASRLLEARRGALHAFSW